jgi:hypothetical protein
MWHPNYLSPIFLFVLVLLWDKLKDKFYIFIYVVIFIAFILTKSFIAISLYFSYLLFVVFLPRITKKTIKSSMSFWTYFRIFSINKVLNYKKSWNKFRMTFLLWFIILSILSTLIVLVFPDKLSSFISRFYIFETAIRIIFSDIKIFLFWVWFDNLYLYFDNFKNIHLYIFENIWFTADRSHNILLDFFVFTWFFWFLSVLFIYFYIFKSLKYKNLHNYWLFLISIFLLLNPWSIVIYIISIFYIVYDIKTNEKTWKNHYYIYKTLLFTIFIFSIVNIYYSSKYYISETFAYKKDFESAINIFPYNSDYYYKLWQYEKWLQIEKIKSENYFQSKINFWYDLEENCLDLVSFYPSVENYFYCWNILNKEWQEKEAKDFYKKWLEKLPDLLNKNSKYGDNIFIKRFINGNRFFSEKYSNIKEILKNFENN